MKKIILFLIILCPFLSSAQGPYGPYWSYEINPIDPDNIIWDSTNVDNLIWDYGLNQKPFFGAEEMILVTDTLNPYDSLIDASVDLILDRSDAGWGDGVGIAFVLDFDHKIDTDLESAGGYFEINVDNDSIEYVKDGDTLKTYWMKLALNAGETSSYANEEVAWYDLITENQDTIFLNMEMVGGQFTIHEIMGFRDQLFDENIGFMGTYSEWESNYFEFFFHAGGVKVSDVPDTLLFRFHFKADSTSNGKNGWAIRNIETGYAAYPVGSVFENEQNLFKLFPNPATSQIRFEDLSKTNSDLTISIFSLDGRKLSETPFDPKMPIDIQFLPPARYIYEILDPEGFLQKGHFTKQ